MSDLTDQQIYDRLGKIKGLPTCSQWAAGFSESIREQIDKGRTLSDRQKVVCLKILKENNKEAQKSLANWESEYNMHHKKKATQLALYYKSQDGGYYGDIVKDILEGKVPIRGKYLKMRNNKYAKKAVHKGADGIIAVAAGAGGHAGARPPRHGHAQDLPRPLHHPAS